MKSEAGRCTFSTLRHWSCGSIAFVPGHMHGAGQALCLPLSKGLLLALLLGGCSLTDSPKSRSTSPNLGNFGLLGSSAASLSSGRPATPTLNPIDRVPSDRVRPDYIDSGTGQYVDLPQRQQVEIDDKGKTISLNFVDVELQEFVRVIFDEVLRETVIIDPNLKGRVTLRTSSPVSRSSALDLIRQTLNANGASLTGAGNTYRVTARSDRKGEGRRLGDSVRIVPVRHISTDEAKAALAPFVQSGTEITTAAHASYISIAGAPAELDNLEQVLTTLDVDQLRGMSFGLFPLHDANATAVANELTQVLGAPNDARSFRSLPITRMNAVLVISSQPGRLSEARKWISRLDRADRDGRKIYVYPVQNRRAADIARILNAMLGNPKADRAEPRERSIAPQLTPQIGGSSSRPSNAVLPAIQPMPPATEPDPGDVVSTISTASKSQRPQVNADQATNSLVVSATVDEWKIIEGALRRLDVMPPQVLIEATIAEVRLNNSLRHGVRWYLASGNHGITLTGSDTGSLSPVFPGFNYAFGIPSARVVLSALEQITDVEIISSPALTVLDNQVAKLQVGDQVPVATRSATSVVNPDAPIVNDIELKDTGIILTVTPRVNASGLVMLDIAQEVSDVVPTTSSTLNSPTIRQRRIGSSVAVRSGMEIVLGGLISAGRTRTNDGIPALMQIPVIGNLFKSQAVADVGRTELIVILRPTVMGNSADIRHITNEIKSRMSGFKTLNYR